MAISKKAAILSGSLILLLAVMAAIGVTIAYHKKNNVASSLGSEESDHLQTSIKAIQVVCHTTDYPETCEKALTLVAGNTTDVKELIRLTFKVVKDHIEAAMKQSSLLSSVVKDPRSAEALKVCREVLDDALDDLQASFDRFDSVQISNIGDIVDDLRVWLSAVLTNQDTCLDAFNVTSEAAKSMANVLKSSSELTANVLAIVDQMSSFLDVLKISGFSRRLLAENGRFPSWVSAGTRRLLQHSPLQMRPSVTVAQDGSGDYRTIHEALATAPLKKNDTYFIIYIKQGVYKEKVLVPKKVYNVVLVGDGPTKTRITGSLNYADGVGTFKTATVAVNGDGFIAKGIGFENSAGPQKHQAVALRVSADRAVFYNCQMDGYQDTLYVHTKRQFYRDCVITGTIDFVFGDAAAVLQNCELRVRKPMNNQKNIVTAQGRQKPREPTGLVLHNCRIVADAELYPVRQQFRTYLGRPWKQYSRTVIMQSFVDDLIHTDGWMPWDADFALSTLFYSEIDNTGPGAVMEKRMRWKGIKNLGYEQGREYSVENFIGGNKWLGNTGVPYFPGLLPQNQAGRIH